MSGTTPPPGSDPGEEKNPFAQPGDDQGASQTPPWAPAGQPPSSQPPPNQPPAWTGSNEGISGGWGDPSTAARPEPPAQILTAAKLMYVGAVLSGLLLLFTFLSRDAIRDAVEDSDSSLSADEIDAAVNLTIGVGIVVGLIGVGLWLWMAAANKAGKSWARVVATILGGLNILFTLFSLSGGGGLNLIVNVVQIALAAYILYLLYRPESSQYYAAVSGSRR
ncbi:hypothetical protein [Jiangella asiatica]|uniref:DUF2127 domain-containing protein n=1 Tax=Jiangella asiatica TaxID=2530372 RepID=A0A4R5CKS4_9ACTN|nr:hypothetical protein [Jiangella asiatica]TDE00912.1 hypothetical protein E1269_24280 [Jiangella asiatica]